MHSKNSKRQRKHKASQSLKGKQQAPKLDALDLLGEELQQDSDVDEYVATYHLVLSVCAAEAAMLACLCSAAAWTSCSVRP
jgi:hypothetical protein